MRESLGLRRTSQPPPEIHISRGEPSPALEDHSLLKDSLELAHAGVDLKPPNRTRGQTVDGEAVPHVVQETEVPDEEGNVLVAAPQGWDVKDDPTEPVVEVLPEGALARSLLESQGQRSLTRSCFPLCAEPDAVLKDVRLSVDRENDGALIRVVLVIRIRRTPDEIAHTRYPIMVIHRAFEDEDLLELGMLVEWDMRPGSRRSRQVISPFSALS